MTRRTKKYTVGGGKFHSHSISLAALDCERSGTRAPLRFSLAEHRDARVWPHGGWHTQKLELLFSGPREDTRSENAGKFPSIADNLSIDARVFDSSARLTLVRVMRVSSKSNKDSRAGLVLWCKGACATWATRALSKTAGRGSIGEWKLALCKGCEEVSKTDVSITDVKF